MIKVSIIMPIYNADDYLKESIGSALSQDIIDFELICIDDGSTDNSANIINDFNKKDSRVVLLHQNNQGSGVARNKGLKSAKGEFITFLDADDWYPSNDVLSCLYMKAKEYDQKMSGGSFIRYYADGRIESSFNDVYKAYKFEKEEVISIQEYQFDYGYHRFLYDRNMLRESNIFFPDYLRFQDPPFFLNAMIQAQSFIAINKPVYAYRKAHKKIDWNIPKVKGLMSGLLENLISSDKMSYDRLHLLIINRIENDFWSIVKGNIRNPAVYYIAYRFLQSINVDLVKSLKKNFDLKELKLYKLIYSK